MHLTFFSRNLLSGIKQCNCLARFYQDRSGVVVSQSPVRITQSGGAIVFQPGVGRILGLAGC